MTDLNRRRFLEDSMFAAAAAVAAGSVTQALGAEEAAPQSTSPIEKLGVAIIGAGGRGGDHINNFASRQDVEVLYVCDADLRRAEGRAKEVTKKQGREPKVVQDMRQVFDDKSVDLISTATPNHWHALTAIWAMQAGKDVYVEKPVSHNVSEGRRMVEAARKYNKICQTGTQSRSNAGMKAMIDYLHAGKIGEVTLARGLCYKPRGSIGPREDYSSRMPAHCNYDLWCGPAPLDPLSRKNLHYDWHWVWSTGNGDLGNQGIHQMDLCRWGLGVDNLGRGVVSYGGRLGYEDAGETANTQVSIHDYGDKTLVFEVRGLRTDKLKGADVGNIFQGSKGYLVMTSYSSGAAFDPEGNMIEKFQGGGDHYGNFLNAVRSRKVDELNADILEGHLSSALCHLANISYRLGEKVSVEEVKARLGDSSENQETFGRFVAHLNDNKVNLEGTPLNFGLQLAINPETESFVNNSQADAMLTREYRAPYVVPAAGQV
ncbi:MAG: Gfo/Idh/MocA family oxidoreductase [Planctomycetaceae bacterium]|nr:Gfo/Idh/MocA family oxidoreductase [Planctomycetaceae bacterium]